MNKFLQFFEIITNKGLISQTFIYLDEKEKAQLKISFAQDEKYHLDLNIKIKKIISFNANARHSYSEENLNTKYNLLNKVYEKSLEISDEKLFDPILFVFSDYAKMFNTNTETMHIDALSNKQYSIVSNNEKIVLKAVNALPIVVEFDDQAIARKFDFEVPGFSKFNFVRQETNL